MSTSKRKGRPPGAGSKTLRVPIELYPYVFAVVAEYRKAKQPQGYDGERIDTPASSEAPDDVLSQHTEEQTK